MSKIAENEECEVDVSCEINGNKGKLIYSRPVRRERLGFNLSSTAGALLLNHPSSEEFFSKLNQNYTNLILLSQQVNKPLRDLSRIYFMLRSYKDLFSLYSQEKKWAYINYMLNHHKIVKPQKKGKPALFKLPIAYSGEFNYDLEFENVKVRLPRMTPDRLPYCYYVVMNGHKVIVKMEINLKQSQKHYGENIVTENYFECVVCKNHFMKEPYPGGLCEICRRHY